MADDESKFVPPQETGGPQQPEETGGEGLEATPEQTQADFELTPEIIEKIMDKVQDIDQVGTAYTVITRLERDKGEDCVGGKTLKRLSDILQNGLLGVPRSWDNVSGDYLDQQRKKNWGKDIRERKNPPVVHFNILGRTRFSGYQHTLGDGQSGELIQRINGAQYVNSGSICMLFDISSFKEIDYDDLTELYGKHFFDRPHKFEQEIKNRSFFISEPANSFKRRPDGKRDPDEEYGFVLSSRVAPRYFRGIIFVPNIGKNDHYQFSFDRFDSDIVQKAREISDLEMEALNNKPELLIPIYDVNGNLQWPRQMSHEEVKKLVAEREAETTSPNPSLKGGE